jgi:hypothetical protein
MGTVAVAILRTLSGSCEKRTANGNREWTRIDANRNLERCLACEAEGGVATVERCLACEAERGVATVERCLACEAERGVATVERCLACEAERGVATHGAQGETRPDLRRILSRSDFFVPPDQPYILRRRSTEH